MRIKDLMRPIQSGEVAGTDATIPEHVDIYNLPADLFADSCETVFVVNKAKQVVGSIRWKKLQYLIQSNTLWKMSSIVNHFEDAVVAVDQTGRIFYASKKYTDILGVPLGRILGKNLQVIESEAALLQVLETKKPIFKEKTYIKTIDKHVSVRMFPLFAEETFYGAVSIFRDVTETNKLNNELKRVSEEAREYKSQLNADETIKTLNIIGTEPKFSRLLSQALVVAKTDATVLIRGENGTGKELIAQLIQSNSTRQDKPFITVNCAAIPDNLVESELFGYEEGAFTDAKKGGKLGKFELANGGTIFLDEVGDMPFALQSKLLRVLQEGEIEKIGHAGNIPVDLRIITATNQPLEEMIENKTFRKDLYYRLNTITLNIPPLRERTHDCMLLIRHFLAIFNEKYGKNLSIDSRCYGILLQYSWPGNVRELKSCIEHAVILCQGGEITVLDLPATVAGDAINVADRPLGKGTIAPLQESLKAYEKELLINALLQAGGNKTAAMKQLGLSRRTFYRKLEQLGIPL